MSPKYSFVLPAYKATFFREAIDSILNQTYTDYELIIVNDASPEDLTSIINSYQDNRIQYYINKKNVGGTDLVAQWNKSITYAKGEYLILASDDDVYHPEYLGKMDVLVNQYPEVNIFRPRVQDIDSNGNIIGRIDYQTGVMSQEKFTSLLYARQLITGIPFYIFKRHSLNNIGGFVNFPLAWFSDDATAIKLSKNKIVVHDDVLFSFRQTGLNISCQKNNSLSLYAKLQATELFYNWFATELESMTLDENYRLPTASDLYFSKLGHMVWLILSSDRKAILLSCFLLKRIKTLKLSFRMIVLKEVLKDQLRSLTQFFLGQ